MSKMSLANKLIGTLPRGGENLFNPWVEPCPDDLKCNGPKEKIKRLAWHLDCKPKYILCGEAGGFNGKRHSGIAFTSERLILEGSIPRVYTKDQRLTSRKLPFSEPSATIVWKTLYNLGIAEHTILWNALPLHPHKPGNHNSNRTPTFAELELGEPALSILSKTFPKARIVAVGRKAEGLLDDMGIKVAGAVRHPANGGATKFAKGVAQIINESHKLK